MVESPGGGRGGPQQPQPPLKFRNSADLDVADCGTQAFYMQPLDSYDVSNSGKRNQDAFFTSSTGCALNFSTGGGLSGSSNLLGLRFSNTNAGQPGSEEFLDTLFA